jgi:L-fucose isomerase
MGVQPALLKSRPYRTGLLSFSDGRYRVHKSLEQKIKLHAGVLAEAIDEDPLLEPVEASEIAYSSRLARAIAKEMRKADVEAAVFNIPVFAFPNFSLISARVLGLPVMLSSPKDGSLPGLGGIMAAHGAMSQAGIDSCKIWGNPLEEPELPGRLSAFCRPSGCAVPQATGSRAERLKKEKKTDDRFREGACFTAAVQG